MTQHNVDCTNRRIPGYQRYLRVRISIPRSAAHKIIISTGCTHVNGPLPRFAHRVHLKPIPRKSFCWPITAHIVCLAYRATLGGSTHTQTQSPTQFKQMVFVCFPTTWHCGGDSDKVFTSTLLGQICEAKLPRTNGNLITYRSETGNYLGHAAECNCREILKSHNLQQVSGSTGINLYRARSTVLHAP